MHFSSNCHSFSLFSKLSDLESNIALYEENSSHILRKNVKKTLTKTTLTYYCQEKRKKHCSFSLSYAMYLEDETGEEWAHIQPEKTNMLHSHISMKKCSEIDFESMRRCFKKLEPQITSIIARNHSAVPIEIMEDLIFGSHLTDTMNKLKKDYPQRFKKCLDNQINKIKRKIKRRELNDLEITIKTSKSFLSIDSEQTEKTLNFVIDNKCDDETKIISPKEKEKIEETSFIPIIFY